MLRTNQATLFFNTLDEPRLVVSAVVVNKLCSIAALLCYLMVIVVIPVLDSVCNLNVVVFFSSILLFLLYPREFVKG